MKKELKKSELETVIGGIAVTDEDLIIYPADDENAAAQAKLEETCHGVVRPGKVYVAKNRARKVSAKKAYSKAFARK